MPTENYSHMVVEMKHMVDGDDLGDGGVEMVSISPSSEWRV
jgi:hypothetical protein